MEDFFQKEKDRWYSVDGPFLFFFNTLSDRLAIADPAFSVLIYLSTHSKKSLPQPFLHSNNLQRDDGSAFMDNVYNPSVKEADKTPDEGKKSENFTPTFTPKRKKGISVISNSL